MRPRTHDPTQQELEAAFCWEREDEVPGRQEMTTFRRRYRLHQAMWRERHGHPIGSQPIAPEGKPFRPVGSRLPLDYARETGANFVTPGALAAVRQRTAVVEPNREHRPSTRLGRPTWLPSVAFNLFGELAADAGLADSAVQTWWPDVPGRVVDVRFAHSPGWLGSRVPEQPPSVRHCSSPSEDGRPGAVDVKYHERAKGGKCPSLRNLERYVEVAEQARRIFMPGAIDELQECRSLQCPMWLEHLLLHLDAPAGESGSWTWGSAITSSFTPSDNSAVADLHASRYRELLLLDDSTFGVR